MSMALRFEPSRFFEKEPAKVINIYFVFILQVL